MGVSLLIGNGLNRCEHSEASADNLIQELEKEFKPDSGGLISKAEKAFPLQFEAIFSRPDGGNDDIVKAFKMLKNKLEALSEKDNKVLQKAKPVLRKADAILTTNYDLALEHCLYEEKPSKTDALGRNRGYVYHKEGSPLPPIYHIHGDICGQHVKNLCLGFLGYQKYLRSSVSNLKQDLKRYAKLDDPFSELKEALPESLFRLFVDDIYIVGFGLNECELILWNLLTIRKELIRLSLYDEKTGGRKQNKIVFYDPLDEKRAEESETLREYYKGFHTAYKGLLVKEGGYFSFYEDVFKEIGKELDSPRR